MPPRLCFATADTILLQFEIPLATVYHTIRFAKSNGIRCIVNPAPARPRISRKLPRQTTSCPTRAKRRPSPAFPFTPLEDARKCAEYLLAQGLSRVVITLGERGSLLATSEGMELIPAFKVDPIDSTGAGDAFIGSFAVFLAEGLTTGSAYTGQPLRRAFNDAGGNAEIVSAAAKNSTRNGREREIMNSEL